MRITFDREACQGHNRCHILAPELFDADEEGYAVLRVSGELAESLLADAELAADNCPEFAITLTDD